MTNLRLVLLQSWGIAWRTVRQCWMTKERGRNEMTEQADRDQTGRGLYGTCLMCPHLWTRWKTFRGDKVNKEEDHLAAV